MVLSSLSKLCGGLHFACLCLRCCKGALRSRRCGIGTLLSSVVIVFTLHFVACPKAAQSTCKCYSNVLWCYEHRYHVMSINQSIFTKLLPHHLLLEVSCAVTMLMLAEAIIITADHQMADEACHAAMHNAECVCHCNCNAYRPLVVDRPAMGTRKSTDGP